MKEIEMANNYHLTYQKDINDMKYKFYQNFINKTESQSLNNYFEDTRKKIKTDIYKSMKTYNIISTDFDNLAGSDGSLSSIKYVETVIFFINVLFCVIGIYAYFKISESIESF